MSRVPAPAVEIVLHLCISRTLTISYLYATTWLHLIIKAVSARIAPSSTTLPTYTEIIEHGQVSCKRRLRWDQGRGPKGDEAA